jgi:hypothetical protein
MKLIQFNQVTWYSKTLALVLFFAFSIFGYGLGFEYGKAVSEIKLFSEFASSSAFYILSEPIGNKEYVIKPDWTIFSHRLSSFQIQYPPGRVVYPRFDMPEDLAPFFGSQAVDLVKGSTSEVINIAFYKNNENLSAEELSDRFIRREFDRYPGQPKFIVQYTPYHIINGIKMIRRSDEDRNIELAHATGIELIFKRDSYIFFITARKEVEETEFLHILRTLKVGSAEDFPLWEQMQKEEAKNFKSDVKPEDLYSIIPTATTTQSSNPLMPTGNTCPRICPFRAALGTEWCDGTISQELKTSCMCYPDCR